MPIELGIWRMGETPQKISFTSIDLETRLEDALCKDLSILSPDLMLIGRQIVTAYGKFIDMLAIDVDGNLAIIELKRNRTPRDVVAQALDYASWAEKLEYADIANIFSEKNNGKAFESTFAERFNTNPPEKLNESHQLIIVASDLDTSTERIINYLSSNYNVPINAVFFRYYKDNNNEYLTRSWLIDPAIAESTVQATRGTEVWNGKDCYVSFGESEHRNWDDACKYGFVSGGHGRWYMQTLSLLKPGMRVFACIPGLGYVGYGIVEEPVVAVKEFMVSVDGTNLPILNAPLKATNMSDDADNTQLSEYLVRITWKKTKKANKAFWEQGMFANQNTACRLRNKFTLEKLYKYFNVDDGE